MITVQTENSTYEIDLKAMTARRLPGVAEFSRPLRRDEETLPLLHCGPINVGECIDMLIQIRDDGVLTARRTSPVIAVRGL